MSYEAEPRRESAAMTGQRHETSVLFSLNDLHTMGAPQQATVTNLAAGSGLIDIREMALRHAAETPDQPAPPAPVAPARAAPQLLMPLSRPAARPWRWLLLAGGVATLALALAVAVLLVRGAGPPPRVVTAAAPGIAPRPERPALPVTTSAPEPETKAKPETKTNKVAKASTNARQRRQRARRRTKRRLRSAVRKATRAKVKTKTRTATKRKGSDLDRMIDQAIGAKPKSPSPAPKQTKAKPLSSRLGRKQVVAGMSRIRGAVQSCYDRYSVPGTALARISIAASGEARKISLLGKFKGTPSGRCVAKAVRRARFARCANPTTITYAFPLN